MITDLTGRKISHYNKPTSTKTFFSSMMPLTLVNPVFRKKIKKCGIVEHAVVVELIEGVITVRHFTHISLLLLERVDSLENVITHSGSAILPISIGYSVNNPFWIIIDGFSELYFRPQAVCVNVFHS